MRYLLSKACVPVLSRLAREQTLFAFDFDGTLSPIVEHPEHARMRDRTRQLLGRLAALRPCVILSGRARADLLVKFRGVQVTSVIGNHGAETDEETRHARELIEQWKSAFQKELGSPPGVWIEDKGLSLSLHYRQAERKAQIRRRILAAARKLEHARIVAGKQVVNIVRDCAPDKGDALLTERDRLGCKWIFYAGDDETDEDAFALQGNIVAVRVCWKRRSKASYYLKEQAEIDPMLESLLAEIVD